MKKYRTIFKSFVNNPKRLGLLSVGLAIAYTLIYVLFRVTLLLGYDITPAYLSGVFLLITIPLMLFSFGMSYALLTHGYRGKKIHAIAPSILLGILLYLIVSSIFGLIDGIMTYGLYL